jgi:hypothetical protein
MCSRFWKVRSAAGLFSWPDIWVLWEPIFYPVTNQYPKSHNATWRPGIIILIIFNFKMNLHIKNSLICVAIWGLLFGRFVWIRPPRRVTALLRILLETYFFVHHCNFYFYYILDRYCAFSQMRYFTDNFLIFTEKSDCKVMTKIRTQSRRLPMC